MADAHRTHWITIRNACLPRPDKVYPADDFPRIVEKIRAARPDYQCCEEGLDELFIRVKHDQGTSGEQRYVKCSEFNLSAICQTLQKYYPKSAVLYIAVSTVHEEHFVLQVVNYSRRRREECRRACVALLFKHRPLVSRKLVPSDVWHMIAQCLWSMREDASWYSFPRARSQERN